MCVCLSGEETEESESDGGDSDNGSGKKSAVAPLEGKSYRYWQHGSDCSYNVSTLADSSEHQILHVCEPPSASSYLALVTALVTALVVTVYRTLLGYERAPKVTVYHTAYRTVFITRQSRIAQERTTPSEN